MPYTPFNVFHECFRHTVKHVLTLVFRPSLPRMVLHGSTSRLTLLTKMVSSTRCKLSCVKVPEFKTSVLGNLVPFLKKFLPAICRGHTESSGGNLRLAVGSTIINVNDLLLGHNRSVRWRIHRCCVSLSSPSFINRPHDFVCP